MNQILYYLWIYSLGRKYHVLTLKSKSCEFIPSRNLGKYQMVHHCKKLTLTTSLAIYIDQIGAWLQKWYL